MITGLINRFFFFVPSAKPLNLVYQREPIKKMDPATNAWNKSVISWPRTHVRSINSIPSRLPAASHSGPLNWALSQNIMKLTPLLCLVLEITVFISQSVAGTARASGICLCLWLEGLINHAQGGAVSAEREWEWVRARVSAEEWCHFSMRQRAIATAAA